MTVQTPHELRTLMGESFTLSDQQWQIVSAPLEPAVVIAGAGSGKTSVMAARVIYLVANGVVTPDQVLGLTFTTKAAGELRAKVTTALGAAGFGAIESDGELLEPTVTTYNAYASRLLTEHGLRIGHEPDTRVMADAMRYQVAARAIARHRKPVRALSEHPPTVINNILELDAQLSEHLVTPEQVRAHDAAVAVAADAALAAGPKGGLVELLSAIGRRDELLDLVEGYRACKQEWGLIDFSDQIALAARLVDHHGEVGRLERAQFPVVLLDEYQDTSVAQATMLSRLFSGTSAATGRGHAVMAVGDPQQAIYGWRGASVSNILSFGRTFPTATGDDVPAYPLTTSQRSDRRILQVANAVAAPLLGSQAAVRPLDPRSDAGTGEVHTIVHETYPDELAWLAEAVARTHADGVSWREIGVLTRDNAHAAAVFDELSRAGIPVEIVGLKGLLALPEVSEVVATLTLLLDLTANAALLQLLTGPRWAIGPRDLALLGRRAKHLARIHGWTETRRPGATLAEDIEAAVSGADPVEITALSDALDDPGDAAYSPAARERFALLASELRGLRAHTADPVIELVRRIIEVTGIDIELASSNSEAARARRENLDLFVKAVADFQSFDGDVTLAALLAYLTAEDEQGNGLDVATPRHRIR